MRKIILTEATLSNVPKLNFRHKLETARLLDSVNTDIIETVSLNGEKSDEILIKTISAQTENAVISCPVTDGNVERAWNAVSLARKPRLNIKLPVSVVNMEYFAHMKAPKMLENIRATVAALRRFTSRYAPMWKKYAVEQKTPVNLETRHNQIIAEISEAVNETLVRFDLLYDRHLPEIVAELVLLASRTEDGFKRLAPVLERILR